MLTMVAWGRGHVLWGLIREGNFSLYSLQYTVDFFLIMSTCYFYRWNIRRVKCPNLNKFDLCKYVTLSSRPAPPKSGKYS